MAPPAQNPFLRADQANAFQQNWYPAPPPAPEEHHSQADPTRLRRAFRPQEQQEVPSKQPSLVPVPVPVMLGPNGSMIPVPMGNGMGVPGSGILPLAPQAPQGIP